MLNSITYLALALLMAVDWVISGSLAEPPVGAPSGTLGASQYQSIFCVNLF